jgi:hypothetical protein
MNAMERVGWILVGLAAAITLAFAALLGAYVAGWLLP